MAVSKSPMAPRKPRGWRRWTEADKGRFLSMREEGLSLEAIAAQLGRTMDAVKQMSRLITPEEMKGAGRNENRRPAEGDAPCAPPGMAARLPSPGERWLHGPSGQTNVVLYVGMMRLPRDAKRSVVAMWRPCVTYRVEGAEGEPRTVLRDEFVEDCVREEGSDAET